MLCLYLVSSCPSVDQQHQDTVTYEPFKQDTMQQVDTSRHVITTEHRSIYQHGVETFYDPYQMYDNSTTYHSVCMPAHGHFTIPSVQTYQTDHGPWANFISHFPAL